nr:aldehyde dehydrogenase family protein [Actinomadura madurae]
MSDLLIDGRLRRATGGRVHPNVNPATEEPIGDAADAAPEDLDAAIGAARRAFDATDWSANAEFRAQCLRQLREALHKERETLRTITVQEAGVPVALTHSIWLDTVLDAPAYWADLALNYPYERDLGAGDTLVGVPSRRKILREPVGVVAAITPWNYPLPLNLFKMVGALAAGCTVVLKPGSGHTLVRDGTGEAGRGAHRHPGRCRQRDLGARPRSRCGPGRRSAGRHGLLHRLDGHRPQDHGLRVRAAQAGVPGAGRQVGEHRPGRRGLPRRRRRRGLDVRACRSGLRAADPDAAASQQVRGGRVHRQGLVRVRQRRATPPIRP